MSSLGRVRARLLCGASSLTLPMASAALVLGVALSGEARAQTTVNPNQTSTYTINPASNPITFGPATYINTFATPGSNAVVGNAGTAWNVTVQGGFGQTITGYSNGINLQSQSTVTNAGNITGLNAAGVLLAAGGSVTNQAGGLINGAVQISGAAGTVTNAGNLNGFSTYGVLLAAGGSVTNQTGGSIIFGSINGVRVSSAAGTVTNAGTITGFNSFGVYLMAGGGVTNSKIIKSTISDAVRFSAGGSLTNQSGGTITGNQNGVSATGAAATVTNFGIIKGTNLGGVYLAAGGSVTNQTGATITGKTNGVKIINAAGTVTNTGTITGTNISGVFLHDGGSVTNSGAISGSGGVNADGVFLFTGGSVTNQAGGTISGQRYGVHIINAAGVVTNAGTITGTTVDGVSLRSGGMVINQAGGTINGYFLGVRIAGGAGTVTNAGTINGTATQGYGVFFNTTSNGNVINQKGGLITGNGVGVFFAGGGSVTNQAGAAITGGALYGGIYITGAAGTVTNAGSINGNGGAAVKFAGPGANTLILQPGSFISGNVIGSTAGGATNALQLGGPSGSDTFNVTNIGPQYQNFASFSKIEASTWTLTGTGNQDWSVQAGTLIAGSNNLSGAFTVSGGVLGGGGTIGSLAVIGGGTVGPGVATPFTTLNVSGNATFASGAFYQVNINPAGQNDKLAIGGSAALTGGSVQTLFAPGSYSKQSYDILHATGGLGGTRFAGVSGNLPGFAETLSYTPTDVFLNLTAGLGLGGGLTINQQNVANVINNFFNAGGALPPGFVPLFGLTGGNLGNALTQLSGEAATGAQQVAFQMMTGFLNIMIDPSVDGRAGFGGGGGATPFASEHAALPQDVASAYASVLKAPPYKAQDFDQRWSAWGSAFGGVNHTSGDPVVVGSHDLSANVAGVAAGFDYHLTRDTLIGFALAGGGTSWSLAQNLGGGRSDAFQAGVYAKTRNGPAYLAASLAYAEHWMSTDRFAFASDHLTARFNAQSYGGRIEGGYRFATDFVGVTPYAALQVQAFHTPSYSETDLTAGGFGLGFAARDATDTRSELGSRFDRQMVVSPDAVLTLRGRAAWAHDWVSNPSLSAAFQALPGASFIVSGATPAKDSALASAGAELRWRSGWSLSAKFDGEFASRSQTYAGTGTVRYTW